MLVADVPEFVEIKFQQKKLVFSAVGWRHLVAEAGNVLTRALSRKQEVEK